MFEQSILLPSKTNKSWTFAASVAVEVTAVSVLLLIPLIYTEQLGRGWIRSQGLETPPPPPPPPLIHRARVADMAPHRSAHPFNFADLRAAVEKPVVIETVGMSLTDPPPCLNCVSGGVPTDGGPISIGFSSSNSVPPPPPKPKAAEPQKPAEPPPGPIKVSQGTQEAKIIRKLIPTYPALARQARVQGTVKLLGVISKEGRIEQLQVLSGHPLLVPAAVDAVKQWTYRPTLLNGIPVEVMAPIDVNFILN